jgi:hypothetical protein
VASVPPHALRRFTWHQEVPPRVVEMRLRRCGAADWPSSPESLQIVGTDARIGYVVSKRHTYWLPFRLTDTLRLR